MARRSGPPGPVRTDTNVLLERWGAEIPPDLLKVALTHRSHAHEAGEMPHNERLEFLGDSVLSIIISDYLFNLYKQVTEADLSRMRAATVSQEPLAEVAHDLQLGDFLYLGRGETVTGGRDKPSILSDAVEALIGATYISRGLDCARKVVLHLLEHQLADAPHRGITQDWKTLLSEYAHGHGALDVKYVVVGEGPDHDRRYVASARLGENGEVIGVGEGSSKKVAENAAARQAILSVAPEMITQ